MNFIGALAEDQEDGLVYAGLAQGYWRKYTLVKDNRSAQLAIQAADNAISYAPEAEEARIAVGRVHFGTGRYEEAVADFHQALELDPDNPDAPKEQLSKPFIFNRPFCGRFGPNRRSELSGVPCLRAPATRPGQSL